MTYRQHGLMSMGLFTLAVGVALYGVARASWPAAAGFVLVNIFSTLGITYWYCGKCTCRRHCCHVFIGAIAERLYQPRTGPYTAGDYAGMLLSAGIVFAYPLYWLWQTPWLLGAFLLIGAIATVQILLAVCSSCPNRHCPTAGWRDRRRPPR